MSGSGGPGAARPATVTYALLALRSWTGYEMTRQVRSSQRLVWPSSESHLYREQRRLVRLGWAVARAEAAGRRTRNRYTISDVGRAALADWLASPPAPATLEIEALVRAWFADQGSTGDLAASLETTAGAARAAVVDAARLAAGYLAGTGAFPERAHLNALVGEIVVDVLAVVADRCERAAEEVRSWDSTVGRGLEPSARARLRWVVEVAGTDGRIHTRGAGRPDGPAAGS